MATETVSAEDDVYVWINKDGSSDDGNKWQVEHLSSPARLLTLDESGDIEVVEAIRRAGSVELENTTSVSGTIIVFQRNGEEILQVRYDSSQGAVIKTPSGTDASILLRSSADLRLEPDHDGDDEGWVFIDNANNESLVEMSINGIINWRASDGAILAQWQAASGGDSTLILGRTGGEGEEIRRGVLTLHADTSTGRPGTLMLEGADGTDYYLWVDTDGKLRIGPTAPGTDDTYSGSEIVGTQGP